MDQSKEFQLRSKVHRKDLDALKGISILAVVLYHMGCMPYGYLGVDAFFVINGYFIIPKVIKDVNNGTFAYFPFLKKRFIRLMPLVILASLVCMLVGAWGMLPDDYENLNESVFATNICANNILAAITTGNYWDVVNDYKPLMHTWYVGILVQFYVLFPLLLILGVSIGKRMNIKVDRTLNMILYGVFALSILLYLIPSFSSASKFYYLPFRLFELCVGGIIALGFENKNFISSKLLYNLRNIAWIGLVFVIFHTVFFSLVPFNSCNNKIGLTLLGPEFFLLITILFTAILLVKSDSHSSVEKVFSVGFIQTLGKMSFSIFIWHQIILAFIRYYMGPNFSITTLLCYVVVLVLLSISSYYFIEKRKLSNLTIGIYVILFVLTTAGSFYIYSRAGVIRDIPELGIEKSKPLENRNTEYIDRIYNYDKDFDNTNKIKVLVVGNSFARDFASVLFESQYGDSITLSYSFTYNDSIIPRIKECDILFSHIVKKDIPQYVFDNIGKGTPIWGIGVKNFGESNGVIYSKRFKPSYFDQTVPLSKDCEMMNNNMKAQWGEYYIDFVEMSKMPNGRIRVFTPNNKFISHDCRHLTHNGAKYFASKIDFENIFSKCK